MKRLLLILFLTSILGISCSPPRPTSRPARAGAPRLPAGRAAVDSIVPVPSTISIPIEMKTRVVEQMINQQIKDLLYESDTMTVGTFSPVKVKVWKREPISIKLEGDELRYRVPLRIWMQLQFTVGALGVSHTEYQDVEAGIALNFRTRLFVKNDWRVVTMTQSEGYEWLSDPVVKIRFVTVPVKPLADFVLNKQKATFGTMVDSAVTGMLDVKKMLAPLWKQLQAPILLSKSPPIWLRLSPQSIYMTQLEGSQGMIRSSVGIKTVAETFVGDTPKVHIKEHLPEFVIPGAIDSSFIINLYSEITYDNATALARSYLQGRSFTHGNKTVIIDDITVSGLNGYALVGLDLSGDFRGRVYVYGNVKYDSTTSTISVVNLDYDVTTRNAAHATAAWLLQGIIIGKIGPYLKFPMKEHLLESQLSIQRMLCKYRIMDNVFVNGAIDSLAIAGVRVTDRALQAMLLAKGTMMLTVND